MIGAHLFYWLQDLSRPRPKFPGFMGLAESSSMDIWGWVWLLPPFGDKDVVETIAMVNWSTHTSNWAWKLLETSSAEKTLKYDIIWHSLWHPFWRSRIPPDIYSDCLAFSAMCSGPGVPSLRWGPAVPTEIWSSQLKQSRLIKSRDPHLGRWGNILQVMGIFHDCWRFSMILINHSQIIHKSYILSMDFPLFPAKISVFFPKTPRTPERRSKSWQICVGPADDPVSTGGKYGV